MGTYADGATEHPLVEHWDGTAWERVQAEDGPGSPALDSFLAVDGTIGQAIWAVGLQGASGADIQPLVERPVWR